MGSAGRLLIENSSGYATADLESFFRAGLKAAGVNKRVRIAVVASPIRSRGCAEVGGERMVIAIAPPSRFELRRLARMFEHEAAHLRGLDHDHMPHDLLYSLGPTPAWAKGKAIRYLGRAPKQMKTLASCEETPVGE